MVFYRQATILLFASSVSSSCGTHSQTQQKSKPSQTNVCAGGIELLSVKCGLFMPETKPCKLLIRARDLLAIWSGDQVKNNGKVNFAHVVARVTMCSEAQNMMTIMFWHRRHVVTSITLESEFSLWSPDQRQRNWSTS